MNTQVKKVCYCGECKECRKAMFDDEMSARNRSLDTPLQVAERLRIEAISKRQAAM